MKLRLQLAGTLPTLPKLAPTESRKKEIFGSAMEEMMAASSSGTPPLAEIAQKLLPLRPPIGMPGSAKNGHAIETLTTKAHTTNEGVDAGIALAPHQEVTEQSEPLQARGTQGQNNQHPDPNATTPSEALLPAQKTPAPIAQVLIKNPAVLKPRAVFQQGSPKQPIADATLPDAASVKDVSSREKHKIDLVHDEPAHPVDGSVSGVISVISQPIELVAPVPVLQQGEAQPQPNGSHTAPLRSNSRVASDRVRNQNANRTAVPVMASDRGDLRGTPPTTSTSMMMSQSAKTMSGNGGKITESISADTLSESSTKTNLARQWTGNANTASVMVPNQALHPQGAHLINVTDANGKQAAPHSLNDLEKRVGTELKSEVQAGGPRGQSPVPLAIEHQVLPNASSTATFGLEKATAMHRPEMGTAQVLQRMDVAGPSGAVQLHADARRLDVGVSSSALGWVEVRATTAVDGRVNATLHAQNDASAQTLSNQSREISDYAREHSVQLGQLSVGVGTGDSAQGQSHSPDARDGNKTGIRGTMAAPLNDPEQTRPAAEAVSLISIRA